MFSGIFNPAVDPAGVYIYTVDDPFGGIHLAMVVVNVLECPERSFTVPVKGNEAQGTASVDDPYSGRRLGIWPNPAHGGLHVSVPFPISGIAHVELIDATGRSFQTTPVLQNKDVLTLDISTLAPGPWTIRISEADRVLTGRFICGLR